MRPKLFTCMKSYTRELFFKDLSSGIIVGIIALPLSIALAIASGVSPEKGLLTAIIGGFTVAMLGGSRVQIAGPTGAFVVIVLNIIHIYGISGLITATFLAGLILIAMGLLKMGSLIKFIPYPITTGFTCGIAIVIFSTQVNDFLGIGASLVPSHFLDKWSFYLSQIQSMNPVAVVMGLATVLVIVLWPKINRKIPGTLVAILLSTLAAYLLKLDVQTIGSRFGEISSSFPLPAFPDFSLQLVRAVLPSAFAIALLGGIESLLSAVVADGMTGGSHRSNTELVAQGTANMLSSLFGGIPVTGAIARTAANVKNGGVTPVSGIIHSLTLLLMMLALMPLVQYIPMASLAGILMVVAYNMGEWGEFKSLVKSPKSDALVFLSTFVITVLFDLVLAIEIGMVLAAFLFMRRMAEVGSVVKMETSEDDEIALHPFPIKDSVVYEINGPFFFGAADKYLSVMKTTEKMPRYLILKMTHVPFIDATGYAALLRFHRTCRNNHTVLVIIGLQKRVFHTLERYGFIDHIGKEHIHQTLDGAARSMTS
ncbi:MAG: SulP family inorganic anion transporter [Clostridia bacterium]